MNALRRDINISTRTKTNLMALCFKPHITFILGFCLAILLFSLSQKVLPQSIRFRNPNLFQHFAFTNSVNVTKELLPADPDYITELCKQEFKGMHFLTRAFQLTTRSMLLLDIGGHEGRTSFPSLVCLDIQHRVITVEPVQSNQEMLISKASQLGLTQPSFHWRLVRAALSNETDLNGTIYIPGKYEDNSALGKTASSINVGGEPVAQPVQIVKGDDLLIQHNIKPDLIKIDVQGIELKVMKGLIETLNEDRDLLVMAEQSSRLMWTYKISQEEPLVFMERLGFKGYCHPELVVHDNVFYVKNVSQPVTVEMIVNNQLGRCDDIVYVKHSSDNKNKQRIISSSTSGDSEGDDDNSDER